MKLSCLPVSLYPDLSAGRRTLGDWFKLASRLGLDGADISVAHLRSHVPDHLDTLRRQAEATGIQIAILVTYSDFTHPDPQERARQADEVRRYIEAAARLGAPFLRVTAGQAHPQVTRAEGIGWAVEGLTACLDEAGAAGVTLVYENHTIGYAWTHYDFSQPADIFLEIVQRTEGTGLSILYDTANPLARGDDPLALFQAVKHRVAVVHASDIRQVGHFEPVILGTGLAPITAIFAELVQMGFDGWVSVEEASRQGESGFEPAIAYADQAWVAAGGTPRSPTKHSDKRA